MPTPALPVTLPIVAAYHGDTTPLCGRITVSGLDVSGAATAHLQIRAPRGERLVATLDLSASVDGAALVVEPVALSASVWAAWPRTLAEADYDVEVRAEAHVVTVVRGSIVVTLDITRP